MTDSSIEPGDRERGEALYDAARQLAADDDQTTAGELAPRTRAERLAEAQWLALQAIYCELRHGHDQARGQAEEIGSHTEAMRKLRGALYDHAAAMGHLVSAMDDHSHAMRHLGRVL